MDKKQLKDFYNSLSDEPLEPGNKFYVPFLEEADGPVDPIADLKTRISWSEAASVNLLSGQRGSGKSTELRRLKKNLEDEGVIVFLCDMQNYMNLTSPVEITDFFISIMGALSKEVKDIYGNDPASRGVGERLAKFLKSEVKFSDIRLKPGVPLFQADITASLKEDQDFKKRLQYGLRGHIAGLIKQVHEYSEEIVKTVRKKHKDKDKKVLLIVDSIEQIRGVGGNTEDIYRSVENLFSGHADALRLPLLHVVYTIPPYLTSLAPSLGRLLGGGTVCTLPSVHIKYRDRLTDNNGITIMEKIVTNRFVDWQYVFTKEQIKRLSLSSGGDLRDFFRLLKDSLVKCSIPPDPVLPIEDKILDSTENHLRRNMLPIAKEDMTWLKKIAKSKNAELESIKELPRLTRFFDSKLVV